jgi:hypothetical protein
VTILIRLAIGPEHPAPEEVDHGEIAVRMQMVGEVKLPLAPEPWAKAVLRGKNRRGRSVDLNQFNSTGYPPQ